MCYVITKYGNLLVYALIWNYHLICDVMVTMHIPQLSEIFWLGICLYTSSVLLCIEVMPLRLPRNSVLYVLLKHLLRYILHPHKPSALIVIVFLFHIELNVMIHYNQLSLRSLVCSRI